MFRNLWFQLHWLVGITAGLVLAVVGVTGGLLSFEQAIKRGINPGVLTVTPGGDAALSPDRLIARVREQAPAKRIQSLTLSADPGDAAHVTFAPGDPKQRRGENRSVDPYTGDLLNQPRGEGFFRTTRELHRWLLLGDVGKQVVGASTATLVLLALSGLYLRWPRRFGDWRTWLLFNPRKQGRSFLWDLHSVIGTWVLAFYLLAALTGLYWSYDWYRDGLYSLSGVPRPAGREPAMAVERGTVGAPRRVTDAVDPGQSAAFEQMIANSWRAFEQAVNGYSTVTLRLPSGAGQPTQFTYQDPEPAHQRATSRISLDSATGAVLNHERYADKPLNARLMGSMLPLHSGEFFGLPAQLLMMLASFGMPVFAVTGWLLYLDRRAKKRATRQVVRRSAFYRLQRFTATPSRSPAAAQVWLIGFASQSGVAEHFAWEAAGALQGAGIPVRVAALSELDPQTLRQYRRALFVVSTFGDGEPPDNARGFVRRVMPERLFLGEMRYGVLALGDRNYPAFCGFGRSLASWLQARGARLLFDPIKVDRYDIAAMRVWRQQIAALSGNELAGALHYKTWQLAARRLLNPGSAGQPTYHVELTPLSSDTPQWQAGDIAEVRVPSPAGVALREYSIASLPCDCSLQLLVREARHEDGSLGLGSGLLTSTARIGDSIEVRIRTNRSFHAPPDDRPMILIGNGTGMAGLRSHLKARAAAGRVRNWLLFGERNVHCDLYYAEEIDAWRTAGIIERLDLAFSRDQAECIYVQDRLRAAKDAARAWVDEGAAIYLCGSRIGMAGGVDRALEDIIGKTQLGNMQDAGLYRKDVY